MGNATTMITFNLNNFWRKEGGKGGKTTTMTMNGMNSYWYGFIKENIIKYLLILFYIIIKIVKKFIKKN